MTSVYIVIKCARPRGAAEGNASIATPDLAAALAGLCLSLRHRSIQCNACLFIDIEIDIDIDIDIVCVTGTAAAERQGRGR